MTDSKEIGKRNNKKWTQRRARKKKNKKQVPGSRVNLPLKKV